MNGFGLEVITEGKVSHHFEKGVVAGCKSDIFKVVVFSSGANTFLGGHGSWVVGFF